MHESGDVTRWSYTDLWERAIEVARALRAVGGIGKDSRVGVLMTNRPEWIAATFGTSLVGGVAVALSTFSTAAELDLLIGTSGISVLLFERTVANRDLAEALTDLEPKIGGSTPGDLQSVRYPHLRYLAAVGAAPAGGAVESWDTFVAGGTRRAPREIVEATAAGVEPSDTAVLFFSSGTTSKPKGILSAHRGG